MAMEFKDYYEILGVPRNASDKEIRQAFRRLARQYHPDVNPGNKEAEERFKEISEAYEVLSDPEKRKMYDQFGARWREYQAAQQAGQATGQGFDWSDFVRGQGGPRYEYRTFSEEDLRDLFGEEHPFSDFFETLFGGGRARAGTRQRARPGQDLEQEVQVTLREAYTGTTRLLEIQLPNGQTRRIEAKIPPGVNTGTRVRMAGQGMPGAGGGPPGDLYLVVRVLPDPAFEREGDDLKTTMHVPLSTMLLGGEVRVRTPDGRTLALRIPERTQDGRVFRLRGQGMPRPNNPHQRGDLLVEAHVRLPERLTPRQRELLEELARLSEGEATQAAS